MSDLIEPILWNERKRLPWEDDALCAQTDPEAFFPEKGGSTRDAKRICRECPVRGLCLEYALENDEHFGIWGGFSERERRKLKAGVAVVTEGVRDRRRARVVALRGEGLTYAAIAERVGLSEGGVRRYLGVSE